MVVSFRSTLPVLAVLLLLTLSLTQLPVTHTDHKALAAQQIGTIHYKPIHKPADIEALTPPYIKPVAYTKVSTLAPLPVTDKKQKFFDMMLPAILISKERLRAKQQMLKSITESEAPNTKQRQWLKQQLELYRAKDVKGLKAKLADHPTSIILAQAAIETGWGTSRFFLKGNNIFGVWSFNDKEPRMKASESRDGKSVYVKKYRSLIEAVDDYFVTLARGTPYQKFRQARRESRNPLELVAHLDQYSEIGTEYVDRLRSMIVHNKMQRFDDYQLQTADTI